jgi:hypothetical protein
MSRHRHVSFWVGAALVTLTPFAIASTIDYQPAGSHFQYIASNDPVYGNVWTGVAQSFTAEDPLVSFGFYTFESQQTATEVLFSLYSGDGQFASLLSQKTATLISGTWSNPTLLSVDFSGTTLSVGQKYTVAITLPNAELPPSGTYSNVSIEYAGTASDGNANPYAGGTFYYTGSSYPPSYFYDRDIAFRVSPVPEPENTALMLSGAVLLALTLRRRAFRSSTTRAA